MPEELVSGAQDLVEGCHAIHKHLAELYRLMPSTVLKAEVTEIRMRFTVLAASANDHLALCRRVHLDGVSQGLAEVDVSPFLPRAAPAAGTDGKSRAANDHTLD